MRSKILAGLGLWLIATQAVATTQPAAGTLRPGEVVVIANQASPESMKVARHYQRSRGIPENHVFTIDYPAFGRLEPMDQNPAWLPYPQFQAKVVQPLQAWLVQRGLKERVLCLVTVHGVPYRVGRFELTPEQEDSLRSEVAAQLNHGSTTQPATQPALVKRMDQARRKLWHSNAALDSELAVLFQPEPATRHDSDPLSGLRSRRGWSGNPFHGSREGFRAFRARQREADPDGPRQYLVARLDAERPELAKALVDRAMAAERQGGLQGRFCLDARGPGQSAKGYGRGDWWLRHAAEILRNAGLEGVYDTRPAAMEPGACPAPAIYWGWYQSFDYRGDIFGHRFAQGAIGCHMASFAAARLWRGVVREGTGGPWCPGLIRDGVAIAIGPVAEPYLQAFPNTRVFFPRLLDGWSVGQAYWASISHTSWRMILVGDPLYKPFPPH